MFRKLNFNRLFFKKSTLFWAICLFSNTLFAQSLLPNNKDCWVAADKKMIFFVGLDCKPEINQSVTLPTNGLVAPGIKWTWQPSAGIDNPNAIKTTFSVSKLGEDLCGVKLETNYTLLSYNQTTGCQSVAMIQILIFSRIKPMEVITPNMDDNNDVWSIENISSYPDAEISIYDRWGKAVYESTGSLFEGKPFNGMLNGKTLPSGTYMYRIVPHPDYGDVIGNITIIR